MGEIYKIHGCSSNPNSIVITKKDYGKFYNAIADISIRRIPMKFLKYLKGNVYELVASQEYNPQLLNVNIEDLESIKNFNDVSQFVGLTFSTEKTIGFCNNYNICQAFLEKQNDVKYEAKDLLQYRKKNIVPFYRFLKNVTKEEILELVANKESDFYKQIENDDVDYKISIGKEQVVDYHGDFTKQEIEKYASTYVIENRLQYNQQSTVIRYVLLQLLNQNMEKVLETESIINEYRLELIKVITHLSNEFIKEKKEEVFKLLHAIDYYNSVEHNVQTEHNFRFMLCYVDRALYRKE